MEKESSISLGGTIILPALFAQNLMFKQKYILSWSSDPVSHFKKVLKYQKSSFFTFPGNIEKNCNGDYWNQRMRVCTYKNIQNFPFLWITLTIQNFAKSLILRKMYWNNFAWIKSSKKRIMSINGKKTFSLLDRQTDRQVYRKECSKLVFSLKMLYRSTTKTNKEPK